MTSTKVNVELCLPEFGATKIVTWKCHIVKSINSRYNMILGIDLLAALGLDLKFSQNIILRGYGPFKGWSLHLVDLSKYDFKLLSDNKVKPKESFINTYVNKCLESNITMSLTCRTHRILDAKHENSDLKKVMAEQCQQLTPGGVGET